MKDSTVEKVAWVLMTLAVICLFLIFMFEILSDEDIPLLRWVSLGGGVILTTVLGYYALTKKKTCPKLDFVQKSDVLNFSMQYWLCLDCQIQA